MDPPFPFSQLFEEIDKDPTNELLHRDIVYYCDQMHPSNEQRMQLMEKLAPVIKYRVSESIIDAVNEVLCEDSSAVIDVTTLVQVVSDNCKRFELSCSSLMEKLAALQLLDDEHIPTLVDSIKSMSVNDDKVMCYVLDTLYFFFSDFGLEDMVVFKQITPSSPKEVLIRLSNILLSYPSALYLDLVVSVLQTCNDTDILVRYVYICRAPEYPIGAVISCAQRCRATEVSDAAATVINMACDDDARKAETISCGGIRWVIETLSQEQPITPVTGRGLYGYIASLCYDASAVQQLSYDPSWLVCFAKSLLQTVTDEGCLKSGFEVVSLIYKNLPEEGEIVSLLAEVSVKAMFCAMHSVDNTLIVLTTTINMSVNAAFSLHLLEWNLEEALDRVLLSGNAELVEKGCALLMNIIVDADAAELLCDHYILLSVDVIEKYEDTVVGARAMGCVAAFAKTAHGREILSKTQLFKRIPTILGTYQLDSLIDKTFIAMNYFTSTPEEMQLLVGSGILEGISHVVMTYDDEDVLEKALNIVVVIAKTEKWHQRIFESKVADAVVKAVALSAHDKLSVCSKALSALINIAAVKESREQLFLLGGVEATIYAVEANKEDEEIVKLGFGALSNLSLCMEVKELVRSVGFLKRVRPFFGLHRDKFVLLKIVTFLYCASHSDEANRKEIKTEVGDLLKKVQTQYGGVSQFDEKISAVTKK